MGSSVTCDKTLILGSSVNCECALTLSGEKGIAFAPCVPCATRQAHCFVASRAPSGVISRYLCSRPPVCSPALPLACPPILLLGFGQPPAYPTAQQAACSHIHPLARLPHELPARALHVYVHVFIRTQPCTYLIYIFVHVCVLIFTCLCVYVDYSAQTISHK